MICPNKDPQLATLKPSGRRRFLHPQGHPSPALCCACGLCIMLAGINITLVGAFGFAKLLPFNNPPIIIGPLLLLVALAFFAVCCMYSRLPTSRHSHKATGQKHWGLMRMDGPTFEMETSEHTLQDTTAVQLSPTNSPCSSHRSSPAHLPTVMLHPSENINSSRSSLTYQTHSSCHSFSKGDDTSPLSPSYDEADS